MASLQFCGLTPWAVVLAGGKHRPVIVYHGPRETVLVVWVHLQLTVGTVDRPCISPLVGELPRLSDTGADGIGGTEDSL